MPVEIFTKDQFEEVLELFKVGWEEKYEYGEWRYHIAQGKKGVLHVASSVGLDGLSKASGKDSIRVWGSYMGKPIKKTKRWITRVPGWEDRLRDRLFGVCKDIRDLDYAPRCPRCNALMILRKGVYGKFYGCSRFPNCRGTRDYAEELPEELEWIKEY